MAPRPKPPAKTPASNLLTVQKYLAELQQRVAALAAATKALQPPAANNPASLNAYVDQASTIPGALQTVLSAWFAALYATLPEAKAAEIAKSAVGYATESIIKSLILTARGKVLGYPAPDPNYVPDMIDRDG